MEEGIINISELKTGQKFTLDIANHEVILTKLDEARKFTIEDWFEDEAEIYIMEDQIEEDEPLHYAFTPISLQQGEKLNQGKFGKNLVMYDFLGRVVEGIEMEEDAGEEEEVVAKEIED